MIWSEQNAWKQWFHLTWFRFCPLMGSRDSGPKWAVGGKSSDRRQNPTNTSSWHRDWWIGSSIWTLGSWWWWRNCTIQLDATNISHRILFCWFVMVGQWPGHCQNGWHSRDLQQNSFQINDHIVACNSNNIAWNWRKNTKTELPSWSKLFKLLMSDPSCLSVSQFQSWWR